MTQAANYDCTPANVGFPVPAPGSFEIISTPIGGAIYPVQNGQVSDNLRFVRRVAMTVYVGPSLPEYGEYSGGAQPSFGESNGALWIFDYRTERGAQVLRVSTTTGAVLQRSVMPPISRPIIAVNAVGFWLAQDFDSLGSASTGQLGVWLAPVGATRADRLMTTSDNIWAMQPEGVDMTALRPSALKPCIKPTSVGPSRWLANDATRAT